MNSFYVSQQPLLTDSPVVTKSVFTLDLPIRLLQSVSVLMLMDLILFTRQASDLNDPEIGAALAVGFLVGDHGRSVEMSEVTAGAGISDNLQVNMLDMVQQGLLQEGGKLTLFTFIIPTFSWLNFYI